MKSHQMPEQVADFYCMVMFMHSRSIFIILCIRILYHESCLYFCSFLELLCRLFFGSGLPLRCWVWSLSPPFIIGLLKVQFLFFVLVCSLPFNFFCFWVRSHIVPQEILVFLCRRIRTCKNV